MLKYITISLFAGILLSSCGNQYVAPIRAEGRQCVKKATLLKLECEAEREPEVLACKERNDERQAAARAEFEAEYEADLTKYNNCMEEYGQSVCGSKPEAYLYELEIIGILDDLENCSKLVAHCQREYDDKFVQCGGSIE